MERKGLVDGRKTAIIAFVMLMLCLISTASLADSTSCPVPSALVTVQSLDQVTAETMAVGGWEKTTRELRVSFEYGDPYYMNYILPYNSSLILFYDRFSGTSEQLYSGSNYLVPILSTTYPTYTYKQVTVRYDDKEPGPCWYFVDYGYSPHNNTERVNVSYHTLNMEGDLDYISVSDWDNRHFYYYPDGVWYQGKQSFIGEWYENVSGTYTAADVSELNIPEFEPVSFNYYGPLTICSDFVSPRLYFQTSSGIQTYQWLYTYLHAYQAEALEIVSDQGEGTEESAQAISPLKGNGQSSYSFRAPTTSQTRRYWARAHYPDGTVKETEPLEISITAPYGSLDEPEISTQYTSSNDGMNTVSITVNSTQGADLFTAELSPANGDESISAGYTLRLPAGADRTISFTNIAAGAYTVRVTLGSQGYEETIFTQPLLIQKTYENVISIPEDTQEIGSEAFSGTDIEFVRVSASAQTIRAGAFAQCEALEVVQIDADNLTIEADAIPAGVIIRCHEGSAVEAWALENGYEVEPLDD